MAIERQQSGTSLIDVLDRVLDKGIVIDAWVRVSVVGIDLITVEARVVVASIETYLRYSEAVSTASSAARPPMEARPSYEELEAENVALRAQFEHDVVQHRNGIIPSDTTSRNARKPRKPRKTRKTRKPD